MKKIFLFTFAFLLLPFAFANAQLSTSLGWQQHTGTSWRSSCPGQSQLNGTMGCEGVTDQWGGGMFDTLRNRLCWWGGGHSAYWGNEIYCFDVTTLTTSRITNPALSPNLSGSSANVTSMSDGSPSARHTYNHLVYIPTIDRYYMFGGSTPTNGNFANDTWFFNPNTNTWAVQSVSGSIPGAWFGMNAQWNPNDNRLYIQDPSNLFSFNPATLVYTNVKAFTQDCSYRAGFLDTKRNEYHSIYPTGGSGGQCGTFAGTDRKISLSGTISANSWVQFNVSGATGIFNNQWIGAIYDKVTDRAVLWDTGNTVYTMDLSTGVITANNLGGTGPAKAGVNGTNSRFNYSPTSGVFVVANGPDTNIYTFRLTDAANNDFYNRCHGTGVIYCNGFDTASQFGSYQTTRPNTGPFCPGAAASCSSLVRDTAQYASCGDLGNCGAAKYLVGANGAGGDNPSGSYEIYYGTTGALETSEAKSIYYQWKARQTSLTDIGGGGWKTFTLYDYKAGSCATLELTQTNSSFRSLPFYYSECGGRTLDWSAGSGPDPVLNWSIAYPPGGVGGATDFYCQYNSGNPAGYGPNKCPFYEVNSWRTYYCEITVGNWGSANSTIRCGQFDDGDAGYRWFINRTNYVLNKEAVATGFNTVSFTNFDTGRGGDIITHPAVDFWLDEVIVATSPIPYPGASPAAVVTPPASPVNIRITGSY